MALDSNITQVNEVMTENGKSSIESAIVAVALTFIIVGAILGNVLVITAVKVEKNLQSPGNFLICSLAVTDLLLACLVMPLSALYEITGTWLLGEGLCQVWTATDICCCTASILHLCAIALERHRSINNAVKYFTRKRKNGVSFKILLVWLLAICISIPPLLGWEKSTINKSIQFSMSNISATIQCQVGHHPGYTVYATCGSFYIPLFLLLVVYSRIYYMIHQHIRKSQSRSHLSLLNSDAISFKHSPKNQSYSISTRSRLSRQYSGTSVVTHVRRMRESVDIRNNHRKLSKQTSGKSSAYHSISMHSNDTSNWHSRNRSFNNSQMPWRNDHVTEICNHSCEKAAGQTQQNKSLYLESCPVIKLSSKNENISRTQNYNILSHPNTLSSVRMKRLSSLCRQLAIEGDQHLDGIEVSKSEPNHSNYSSFYSHSFKIGQTKQVLTKNDFDLRKTQSENDVTNYQPRESLSRFIRPRTRTASARVRFKSLAPQDQDHAQQNDLKQLQKQKSESLAGSQVISTNRSYCCSCVPCFCSKKAKDVRIMNELSNQSPLLLHSLSMRAKLKMLKAREIRAIRTLGAIVGGFIICWLPFFIVTIVAPFCDCVVPRLLKNVVLWLGYCNSLLNPVLYAAFNHDFHCAFKKLLGKQCSSF